MLYLEKNGKASVTGGFCLCSSGWLFKLCLQKKVCCCCSVTQSCLTLYDPMNCSTSGYRVLTISWSLLKLMCTESVIPSNLLILCHPLLLLPSILPSIGVFSNELALPIRLSKYWSFSISPSKVYSGLISFRIDWFDFLSAQGTLRSLLQYCIQQPISIGQWRFTHSTRISSGITRVLSMSSSYVELLKGRSLLVRAWPMWSIGEGNGKLL